MYNYKKLQIDMEFVWKQYAKIRGNEDKQIWLEIIKNKKWFTLSRENLTSFFNLSDTFNVCGYLTQINNGATD